MFIKIEDIKQYQIWNDVANKLNGTFSMPLQIKNGGSSAGGMYLFNIKLLYKNVLVNVHTGLYEFPLRKNEYNDCDITITAKKETKENIELSIWRKDYIDRLFSFGKTRTGYKKFDKIIGIQSSRNVARCLPKIFESEDLREVFINDNYRAYNVSTKDCFINVNRRSSIRLENSELIISEYKLFCQFLDGLINARIL